MGHIRDIQPAAQLLVQGFMVEEDHVLATDAQPRGPLPGQLQRHFPIHIQHTGRHLPGSPFPQ